MNAPVLSKHRSPLFVLLKDPLSMGALLVVGFYLLISLLSMTGLLASNWNEQIGASYLPPSWEHPLGLDIFGRSIWRKTLKGTEIAMSVGLVTSTIGSLIGITLGAVAGHYGGKVDNLVVWFYSTVASIPNIMLLVAITFILGKGILSVYLALGLTSWVNLCRLIRGEVIRHKNREYVHAASALGISEFRKLFVHILPNVFHVVIINFSLQFQMAIKSEVILSYLGLGVQNRPSWGTMIDDAKLELARGVWWQLAAATTAMFVVVLALNVLGDALRDALDPKLRGR